MQSVLEIYVVIVICIYLLPDKISAHFRLFKPCSPNRREFIDAALRYLKVENQIGLVIHIMLLYMLKIVMIKLKKCVIS